MLAGELKAREAKLLAEQKERAVQKERALQKERAVQERARQRAEAREEEKRRARLQAAADEQAAREQEWAETEHNRGVFMRTTLIAVPADESIALTKGIKRSSDKVFLPRSIGSMLDAQDAPKNGPPLFRLSTLFGTTTHAGVLEYTAPEGTIALPRKVARCLFPGGVISGSINVAYMRLPKGEFVQFQPLTRGFHEAVGDSVREVLEAALVTHCTLSEGDVLDVDVMGETFTLQVRELRPASGVSVIDTDIEAEVVASLETEQHIAQWQAEQARQAAVVAALQADRERLAAQAAADESLRQQLAAERQAAELARRERIRSQKEASLPPEPSQASEVPSSAGGASQASSSSSSLSSSDVAGHSASASFAAGGQAQPVLSARFRLPDGTMASRRVLLTSPLQLLFDFVDSKGAGGLEPGSYQIVTQYPRRVLHPHDGEQQLHQLGLKAGQEAFFVEVLPAAAAPAVAAEQGSGQARQTGQLQA